MSDELKQEVQDVPVETFLKTYQAPAPALVDPLTELALVNITDQVIEALGAEAAGLTIAGVDDKDGYEKVHTVEMKIRAARVKAEKFLKGAREPFSEAQKKYVALEKVIVAKFEAIEKPLSAEKKRINDEKARIVAEAAKKERDRVQALVDQLKAVGDFATVEEIAVLSDEEFASRLATSTKTHEDMKAEQIRKDNEAKALREENERLRAQVAASQPQPDPAAAETVPASVSPGVHLEKTSEQSLVVGDAIPLPKLIEAIRQWSVDNKKPVMEHLNASTIRLICKDLGIPTEVSK